MKIQTVKAIAYDTSKGVSSEEVRTMIRLFSKELTEMVNDIKGKSIDTTGLMESMKTFNKSLEDLAGKLSVNEEKEGI